MKLEQIMYGSWVISQWLSSLFHNMRSLWYAWTQFTEVSGTFILHRRTFDSLKSNGALTYVDFLRLRKAFIRCALLIVRTEHSLLQPSPWHYEPHKTRVSLTITAVYYIIINLQWTCVIVWVPPFRQVPITTMVSSYKPTCNSPAVCLSACMYVCLFKWCCEARLYSSE